MIDMINKMFAELESSSCQSCQSCLLLSRASRIHQIENDREALPRPL